LKKRLRVLANKIAHFNAYEYNVSDTFFNQKIWTTCLLIEKQTRTYLKVFGDLTNLSLRIIDLNLNKNLKTILESFSIIALI